MAEPPLKSYRGNCHCGAFVYEVTLPEITKGTNCNCSVCYKKGATYAAPSKQDFRWVKGSFEELATYAPIGFTSCKDAEADPAVMTGNVQHKFCPTCGTPMLALSDTTKTPLRELVINIRTIQGLDVWALPIGEFNGLAMGPTYAAPAFEGPLPEVAVEEGKNRLYTGSCHCGAVRIALVSPPLDETYPDRVVECDCSVCMRNGYVWIYPLRAQVSVTGMDDSAAHYRFGRLHGEKGFCPKCGMHLYNRPIPAGEVPGEDDTEEGREREKKRADRAKRLPINLRCLNDVRVDALEKITQRLAGSELIGPEYVNP